ncbi:MAG: GyrI-like domain-containing protein [Anaerolineae bacterium]|nr:GyrI-like domain-containing protein [Anaerolineae bacterium]
MPTLDLKQTLKSLYAPSARAVSAISVPPLRYLMIDGSGDPNTARRYRDAVGALYGLAYAVRALAKEAGEVFTVMPLEGLWTFAGAPVEDFQLTSADKDRFIWTLMILQPETVDAALVERARQRAAKGKPAPALLDDLRFALYDEGEAVQIMHIGPYDAEGPTIARLHDHIARNGWALSGKHHEIYLSDPRRTPPEKMKTVLRQPFARS